MRGMAKRRYRGQRYEGRVLKCDVIVADYYRNTVYIGTRGCETVMEPSVETSEEVPPTALMDITGPHPATFRRRLVPTKKGYLGLTAEHVERGDQVVVLMGGQIPFILRKVDRNYMLISEAYVHDIMNGQAQGEKAK